MNLHIKPLLGILGALIIASCTNYKKVAYFQNIPESDSAISAENFRIETSEPDNIVLQPDNLVQVSISTLESALNSTTIGSVGNSTGQTILNNSETSATGYLIDKNGNITIPLLGEVQLSGLTTVQAKEAILSRAKRFYKEPVVTVRLSNFKINVLGEVSRPGQLIIPTEQANILDVLTLAGDLTIDGERTDVLVMRKEGKKYLQSYRIDLTSTSFMNSPYFYVKQGDVIYVKPNKNKASQADNVTIRNYSLYVGLLGTGVTLINLYFLIKNNSK